MNSDDVDKNLYLFQKQQMPTPFMGSGLGVLLQVLSVSLEVLLCILHSLSVNELKHIPAEAQPEDTNR